MADLTDAQRQQITDYLSHPLDFPPEFKNYISDYVGLMIPKISVNQIFGFELWSIETASPIETGESCSNSSSYVDLATVGPEITNLANGFYIVIWGCNVGAHGLNAAGYAGLSVNGATPTEFAGGTAGAFGSASLVDFTLGSGGNSLRVKYKVQGVARTFSGRWLHALRVRTD